MTDQRRVCDLTPAELLEAAILGCSQLGWATGPWDITVGVNDGHLRRVRVAVSADQGRTVYATVTRKDLSTLHENDP